MPLGLAGAVLTTGAIPWPAVQQWCEVRGLGRRESSIVAAVLRRLDEDHARREHERIRQAAQTKG